MGSPRSAIYPGVTFLAAMMDASNLDRRFNAMVPDSCTRAEKRSSACAAPEWLRAEYLATMGEMAAGLAQKITEPAGPGSPGSWRSSGRNFTSDFSGARRAFGQAPARGGSHQQIVSELLEIARPKPPVYELANLVAVAEHAFCPRSGCGQAGNLGSNHGITPSPCWSSIVDRFTRFY